MRTRTVTDLSGLDKAGDDQRMDTWWGNVGFMALEGMGFVLAAGVFLYVAWLNPEWPLGFPPQPLLWSSIFTVVMVLSLIPNLLLIRASKAKDNGRVRPLMVLMSLIGIAVIVFRFFEFTALTIRWDTNVYGSILWVFLGLHTSHLLTEVSETIILTAMVFTKHAPETRFTDVDEDCMYWIFVVIAWLPFYGLLYFAPRIGGG